MNFKEDLNYILFILSIVALVVGTISLITGLNYFSNTNLLSLVPMLFTMLIIIILKA